MADPLIGFFLATGAFVAGRLDDDGLYALFLDLCRGRMLGMPRLSGAESWRGAQKGRDKVALSV